jgi:hypothetical protein
MTLVSLVYGLLYIYLGSVLVAAVVEIWEVAEIRGQHGTPKLNGLSSTYLPLKHEHLMSCLNIFAELYVYMCIYCTHI